MTFSLACLVLLLQIRAHLVYELKRELPTDETIHTIVRTPRDGRQKLCPVSLTEDLAEG